jgi:hypothetical protein
MAIATSISHENYWTSFEVSGDDIDNIINLLLEREVPLTSQEMIAALVEYRLERLEQEAAEEAASDHIPYLPGEAFSKGQILVFPALGNEVGKVVGVRSGENPELGEFDVIQVAFDHDGATREFAARLQDHILNKPPEPEFDGDEGSAVDLVIDRYGALIEEKLDARLEESEDILRIAGKWFPKALVADINEGHLNLAEAVLDVSGGGPLPTSEILKHVDLPSAMSSQLAEFSMDYVLQEDERFDEVGPAGQVLWFLRRLEPPEVQFTPPRLESESYLVDRSVLTKELLDLEARLDDELSPLVPLSEPLVEVTISLIFPHWRVGVLPLSSKLRVLFPTAYETPRIRFILVDGHSGEKFPGWVLRNEGFVFGLEEWFQKYEVPAGGLVKVRSGLEPGEVIVETMDRRMRNDWIRTVTITGDGQIGFTMLKQPVGTAYDDLMVIGLIDKHALDEAWLQGEHHKMPIERIVAHTFRELAKLTPQTAVHAQTLYAGVNVIRRVAPAVVFQELVTKPYFVHVGDLYWRFESSAWGQA